MRERPILFSAPMVRAMLDGRKSQTRRVIKDASGTFWDHRAWKPDVRAGSIVRWVTLDRVNEFGAGSPLLSCPYGVPGDRLWVRETFARKCEESHPECILYLATSGEQYRHVLNASPKKVPSIFMPRWASRITLEVTEVRVERVQSISEEDCSAEGLSDQLLRSALRANYHDLWDSINGKRPGCGWADNPWVWAITFRRLP